MKDMWDAALSYRTQRTQGTGGPEYIPQRRPSLIGGLSSSGTDWSNVNILGAVG